MRIYALEGVRGWNKVARRFHTLAPTSQRSGKTCARIVRLWLRTGDVWAARRKAVRSRGRHAAHAGHGDVARFTRQALQSTEAFEHFNATLALGRYCYNACQQRDTAGDVTWQAEADRHVETSLKMAFMSSPESF